MQATGAKYVETMPTPMVFASNIQAIATRKPRPKRKLEAARRSIYKNSAKI